MSIKITAVGAALALVCGAISVSFLQAEAQEVVAKTPILPLPRTGPITGTIGSIEYTLNRRGSAFSLDVRNAEQGTLWFWVGWYDQQKRLFSIRRMFVTVTSTGTGLGIALAEKYLQAYHYRLVYFGKAQPLDPPRPRFEMRMTEPARPELVYTTPDFALAFTVTQRQVGFVLRNTSSAPIRVIWDESAFIDHSGRAHRVMHEGIRYSERDRSMVPTLVPPGASLSDFLFPTSYVSWVGNEWVERPLYMPWEATPFTLGAFLTLEVRGQKAGLSFRFTAMGSAWPQEIIEMFGE